MKQSLHKQHTRAERIKSNADRKKLQKLCSELFHAPQSCIHEAAEKLKAFIGEKS